MEGPVARTPGQVVAFETVGIARIDSVEESGGQLVVPTTGAPLDEFVQDGVIAWDANVRFDQLPAPLREFVFERFQPLDEKGEIWIWGRSFVKGDRPRLRERFSVTRDDRYFVLPEETLATGQLTLGGRPVTAPVVRLSPGDWQVEYEGGALSFYLLWLPANGERVRPVPRATGFPWPLRYRGLVGHRRLESAP